MACIQRILVPVDFSDHSSKALDMAMGLAKTFGAEIRLIHCFQPFPSVYASNDWVVPGDFTQEARDAAVRRLEQRREKVAAEGIDVQATLSEYVPSSAIVEMAAATYADLIVMGTRGLTGIKHLVHGSVAEHTVRAAPCPVLTVKAPGG